MSETWLTPEEVEELTARKQWAAQRRALTKMGIAFLANAVGRPLVERTAVLKGTPKQRVPKKTEPNWDALKRPRGRDR